MHDGFNTLPKLLLVLGLLVVVAHIVLAHLVVSSYGDTLRGAEDIEREELNGSRAFSQSCRCLPFHLTLKA